MQWPGESIDILRARGTILRPDVSYFDIELPEVGGELFRADEQADV